MKDGALEITYWKRKGEPFIQAQQCPAGSRSLGNVVSHLLEKAFLFYSPVLRVAQWSVLQILTVLFTAFNSLKHPFNKSLKP